MEVNDIIAVRFYCNLGIQTAVNVRHWRVTAKAGTGATMSQVLTALAAAGVPVAYKACLVANAVYEGMDAQVIHPVLSIVTENQDGAGVGQTVGDVMPPQISGLVTVHTALGGRANRGRIYVPFPCELDNTSSAQPSALYQDAIRTLGAALTAPIIGAGAGGNSNDCQPVIWHRDTQLVTPITSITASDLWATQRRRGYYGRPNKSPFSAMLNPGGLQTVKTKL